MAAALTGKRLLTLNALSTDFPAVERQKLVKKIEQQERAAVKARTKYEALRQENIAIKKQQEAFEKLVEREQAKVARVEQKLRVKAEVQREAAERAQKVKQEAQKQKQQKDLKKQEKNHIIAMLSMPDLFEANVKPKIIFTNEDITVSAKKFKEVAEMVDININQKVESSDLSMFSKKMTSIVSSQMQAFLTRFGSYKIAFELDVMMHSESTDKTTIVPFTTGSFKNGSVILNNKNFASTFHDAMQKIIALVEEFQKLTSDWVIVNVEKLVLIVGQYIPASGASYIELSTRIKNKKCCINIQNTDQRCFEYSVLCGLHFDALKEKTNIQRVSSYKDYINTLNFDGIEFPVQIDDVERFEKQNELPVNVFGLDKNQDIIILHSHTFKCEKKIINLLLIEEGENSHYVYVKSLNALFQKEKCNNFICEKCLTRFSKQSAIDAHVKKNRCEEFTGVATQSLPQSEDKHVRFKNIHKQLRVPFVLYADGESILKAVEANESKTQIYQSHQYNNIGVKLVSEFPDKLADEYKQFDGENCVMDFFNYCLDVQDKAFNVLRDETHKYYRLDDITPSEKAAYDNATECHICKSTIKPVKKCTIPRGTIYKVGEMQTYINKEGKEATRKTTKKDVENAARELKLKEMGNCKVLDHCHITGKYRGAAHRDCNLNYNYSKFKLPVIFHNLKGYDSHFLLQYAGLLGDRLKGKDISVIPTTMEKYLSFSIDKCVFLDSAQFMASSLESLVSALNKVHTVNPKANVFAQFNSQFNITPELNDMLRQKGVFPYDWYDSESKLKEEQLPSKEMFYNKLNESDVSHEDYSRACDVFKKAECSTFYDYMSIYLKTDVLLLADVFEAFRKMCKNYYDLDPCHYYTAPGFSWDSMLKMTSVSIDCFQDGEEDMLNMVKSGMRGGMSVITHRYVQANNKYMKKFDATKESSHIMYLDANNLYGWAMSQHLPVGNYAWGRLELYTEKYIKNMLPDSSRGCVLEVDLEVPVELHDYFNDYPLAPESCIGEYSPLMKNIMEKFEISQSAQTKKLISNLHNKTKYVLHYRNLQLYLSLGLKLTNVHRVLEFDQSDYLSKYIEFNTKKRAESKNDFEKDLFKLFNNSIFGKTCENIEKRIEVTMCIDSNKFLKNVSKPHFKNFKIFSEGLIACEMSKTQIKYDKPMIVGMCILDLSKHLMYDFHYNTIKRKYGDKSKLLFTDTDSLCYYIRTEDVYEDMKTNADVYDFSDYPKHHSNYSETNKKIIGKFKDEANSKPIVEFCGLRAKMYCFLTDEEKTKAVAKGCKRNVIKKFKMQNYKDCLFGNTKAQLQQQCTANFIRQKNHQVHSVHITKTSLSGIDDKRAIRNDNINTYAHGHHMTVGKDY